MTGTARDWLRDDLGPTGGIGLDTERLEFSYPDGTVALSGVDLRIEPGELVALVGQNGSGKSTLVRHFNGLLRATSGVVRVGAEPVGRRHVAELARSVGVAFQSPDRQIFSARVRQEVAFGARNAGLSGAALDRRVLAALRLVGLDGLAEKNPYDLGASRRKLLTTASVVAMGTPVVVLDEPTTGQDARGVGAVQQLVKALAALRRTVIVISHDMGFVAECFHRVVVLRRGRVILDGPTNEVFAEPNWPALASTYLEPPMAARLGARLGLGSTATLDALIAGLARGARAEPAKGRPQS